MQRRGQHLPRPGRPDVRRVQRFRLRPKAQLVPSELEVLRFGARAGRRPLGMCTPARLSPLADSDWRDGRIKGIVAPD